MCEPLEHREPWTILRAAVIVLALAVFGWGLHYKLALYSTHVPPAAKLLSQRERVQVTEISLPPPQHTVVAEVVFLAALGMYLGLFRGRRIPVEKRRVAVGGDLFRRSNFIRPPPTAI